MFDAHASQLISLLPALPGLDHASCRRALSAAYFAIVRGKLGLAGAAADMSESENIRSLLRRMVDALESAGVFDPMYGLNMEAQAEEACAFVAAEALSLLTQLPDVPDNDGPNVAQNEDGFDDAPLDAMQEVQTVLAIEAGLLYLIGGYDINAVAIVRDLPSIGQRQLQTVRDARFHNAEVLRERLKDLCSGRVGTYLTGQSTGLQGGPAPIYVDLAEEVRTWIYHHLASALGEFLAWLGGEPEDRRARAREIVASVQRATALRSRFPNREFADMHHLASLLGRAFDRTAMRSVAHVLPRPPTQDAGFLGQFEEYLRGRVRGTLKHHSRPFLWPSAMEYVQQCLPGPSRDAVVAMPTGSGKSFVAELGIVHALSSGIFRASRMWSALQERGLIGRDASERTSVIEWLAILFDTLVRLPPKHSADYHADEEQKTATVLTRLRDSARPHMAIEELPWAFPTEWVAHWQELQTLVAAYMSGSSYAELARLYYGPNTIPGPVPPDRVQAKPIPGVFGFIRDVIEPLARDAGCLVALLEQSWKAEAAATPPEALQALPLCVRFGCNSHETLAWFRFGFRQRVSAHALAAAFPLTPNINNDAQRATEVRRLRRQWLSGQIGPVVDGPILEKIAVVLREAGD